MTKSPTWLVFYWTTNQHENFVGFSEYMNLPTVWPINDVTAEIVSRLSGISSPGYKNKKNKNIIFFLSAFVAKVSTMISFFHSKGYYQVSNNMSVLTIKNEETCLKKLLTKFDIPNPEFRLCEILIIYFQIILTKLCYLSCTIWILKMIILVIS